jgi:DNA adenine methylase
MSIKSILKYPGAKWSLASWIVGYFPPHEHYLEPYCGSAACFFSKAPAPHEILGDVNNNITNLFQVLREQGEELAHRVALTPWSEEEYHRYERNYSGTGDAVEDARRFLVRCWQAHGVRMNNTSGWRHNGLAGRVYPTRLWKQVPERLLETIERLKDAEIRNRPALELIDYYHDPGVLIYCDPPYVLATRQSKMYAHEMTNQDHRELLEILDLHPGPVVLSGYAHPLYDERLAHWYRVETPSVAEHGKARMEVLWLNPKVSRFLQQVSLFHEYIPS